MTFGVGLLEAALTEVDAAPDDDQNHEGQHHGCGELVLTLVVRESSGPDRDDGGDRGACAGGARPLRETVGTSSFGRKARFRIWRSEELVEAEVEAHATFVGRG